MGSTGDVSGGGDGGGREGCIWCSVVEEETGGLGLGKQNIERTEVLRAAHPVFRQNGLWFI